MEPLRTRRRGLIARLLLAALACCWLSSCVVVDRGCGPRWHYRHSRVCSDDVLGLAIIVALLARCCRW